VFRAFLAHPWELRTEILPSDAGRLGEQLLHWVCPSISSGSGASIDIIIIRLRLVCIALAKLDARSAQRLLGVLWAERGSALLIMQCTAMCV